MLIFHITIPTICSNAVFYNRSECTFTLLYVNINSEDFIEQQTNKNCSKNFIPSTKLPAT